MERHFEPWQFDRSLAHLTKEGETTVGELGQIAVDLMDGDEAERLSGETLAGLLDSVAEVTRRMAEYQARKVGLRMAKEVES
jgi:hypothetical protein